jgi:hypothetical protein
MKNSFEGFKMLFKRQTSTGDLCVTSAYISFQSTAMKQLGITLGDTVAIGIMNEDSNNKRLIIAASTDPSAYEVAINPKIKRSAPITFVSIGKKHPELKGNYYLKRYGSHEGHEWWEMTTTKPSKIRFFNKIGTA